MDKPFFVNDSRIHSEVTVISSSRVFLKDGFCQAHRESDTKEAILSIVAVFCRCDLEITWDPCGRQIGWPSPRCPVATCGVFGVRSQHGLCGDNKVVV